MSLCLAESLIECQGFDPSDQMVRYLKWYREGYLSSTGTCFDIGNTIRAALTRFEEDGQPYQGSSDPFTAGNGSLMRLSPVPMFYASDIRLAIERSADSSRTTHAARTAIDACRHFNCLLVGALDGRSKSEILAPHFCSLDDYWIAFPLTPEVIGIANGSYKHRQPPKIRSTGYVVHSLEAALWAFFNTNSFREGCLAAVNLDDDADTTGAVYGQLAGSFYGVNEIPESWRSKLTFRELITSYADQIFIDSQTIG